MCTLTHVLEHTQTPTHSRFQLSELGAGQVPFMNGESAPPPAPWGLLQMPGVILSLDQWMTFGDTVEMRGRCSGALSWREISGSREGSLDKGGPP